jgi:hypothetical protein
MVAWTMLENDPMTAATHLPPRATTRGSEGDRAGRQLGKDNDKNSYFVDADGNAYEPYAMAWRYLGLFIDCSSDSDEHGKQQRNKRRSLNNNNNNNNGSSASSCQRRLLWAAYHDPHYQGGSMGEYSLLDRQHDRWTMATCRGQTYWPFTRCKKMDCHTRRTSWQLIGVYKESDGLDDWTEQLFKHHGYCHWGQDVLDQNSGNGNKDHSRDGNDAAEDYDVLVSSDYEFMQNVRETWSEGSSSCRQLNDMTDANGNLLYAAVQPLKRGDMTMGLYTDSACLEPKSSTGKNAVHYGDYLAQATAGVYDDDTAYTAVVSEWQSSVDRWNDLLSDYKVCQPCRAFSQTKSFNSGNNNNKNNNNNYGSNEGEGSQEQWGFNCYDDAGYRNCNQCYKFATKTDMQEASVADLAEATRQGTILAIQYTDGVTYGAGHPVALQHGQYVARKVSVGVAAVTVVASLVWAWYRLAAILQRRRQVQNVTLQEDMLTGKKKKSNREAAVGDKDGTSDDDTSTSSDDHHRRRRRRRRQRRSSQKQASTADEQNVLAEQIRVRDASLALQAQQLSELQQELDQYRIQHQQRTQQWQPPPPPDAAPAATAADPEK